MGLFDTTDEIRARLDREHRARLLAETNNMSSSGKTGAILGDVLGNAFKKYVLKNEDPQIARAQATQDILKMHSTKDYASDKDRFIGMAADFKSKGMLAEAMQATDMANKMDAMQWEKEQKQNPIIGLQTQRDALQLAKDKVEVDSPQAGVLDTKIDEINRYIDALTQSKAHAGSGSSSNPFKYVEQSDGTTAIVRKDDPTGTIVGYVNAEGTPVMSGVQGRANMANARWWTNYNFTSEDKLRDDHRTTSKSVGDVKANLDNALYLLESGQDNSVTATAIQTLISKGWNTDIRAASEFNNWRNPGGFLDRLQGSVKRWALGGYTDAQRKELIQLLKTNRDSLDAAQYRIDKQFKAIATRHHINVEGVTGKPASEIKDKPAKPPADMSVDELLKNLPKVSK